MSNWTTAEILNLAYTASDVTFQIHAVHNGAYPAPGFAATVGVSAFDSNGDPIGALLITLDGTSGLGSVTKNGIAATEFTLDVATGLMTHADYLRVVIFDGTPGFPIPPASTETIDVPLAAAAWPADWPRTEPGTYPPTWPDWPTDWPDWPPPWPPWWDPDYSPTDPPPPMPYDPDTFDATVWTDVTALVAGYHMSQDATMPIDQLSLNVPADWALQDVKTAFKEMRVILVQEAYVGSDGVSTAWHNVAFAISDGYQEKWDNGLHSYVVEAKDVLKLANLERLAAVAGSAVYQADTIKYGGFGASHFQLTMLRETTDAYEYGVTITGDDGAAVQPNWADRPAPRFWCHNCRDKDNASESEPIPLTGDAIQAVFGEGIVRVGKTYAHGDSDNGGATDYSQGLNVEGSTDPDIRGIVYRYAHPAGVEAWPGHASRYMLPPDVVDGLHVDASSAGSVTLSANVFPCGLTILLRDGTGRRYATVASGTPWTATATLTLTDSSVTIPVGTNVQYGDGNLVRDVLTKILLTCGYQTADATLPFYLHPVTSPTLPVALDGGEIVLPPIVVKSTESLTALGFIERLRQDGMVPPNYVIVADADGHVVVKTVAQLAAGNPAVVPLTVLPATPGMEYERTDINVFTRAVVRGQSRQATDVTQPAAGTTLTDLESTDDTGPNLPAVTAGVVTVGGASVTLNGNHIRSGSETGGKYIFELADMLDRSITVRDLLGKAQRPWGWYYHQANTWPTSAIRTIDKLKSAWVDRYLLEIVFSGSVSIDALEISAPNSWYLDTADWGGNRHTSKIHLSDGGRQQAHADPQVLGFDYWDATQARWSSLASGIQCDIAAPFVVKVESDAFDTREAVTTSKIRLRCESPFFAECGTHDESWYHGIIGVYLSQLKVWADDQVVGVAKLGDATNYGGELATAAWQAVIARLRTRTYEVPDVVPWVQDEDTADWLALEWLKQCLLDLAPRQLAAVRPDVRKFDTVTFTTPSGDTATYLVQTVDIDHGPVVTLTAVDETNPYFEA